MNEDEKLELYATLYQGITTTIGGALFTLICLWISIKGIGLTEKIIIIPFTICGIAVLIRGITSLLIGINTIKISKNKASNNLENVIKFEDINLKLMNFNNFTHHVYIFGFFLFWFGFLIVFDYLAIKSWNDGGKSLFCFSLLFWVAGILILRKNLKK